MLIRDVMAIPISEVAGLISDREGPEGDQGKPNAPRDPDSNI